MIRGDAHILRVCHILSLIADNRRGKSKVSEPLKNNEGHRLYRRALLLDRLAIIVRERFTQALFAREAMRRAQLQLVHPQGARAELLRGLNELLIKPGDNRRYGDDGGGPDQ